MTEELKPISVGRIALFAENNALRERVKRLEDALRFYENKKNYESTTVSAGCKCCYDIIESSIEKDSGKTAQQALKGK